MRGDADDFCVGAGSWPMCLALCTRRTLLASRPHRSCPRNRMGKTQRVRERVRHAVYDMNSLVLAVDLAATSSNARCAVKNIANVLWSLFRSHVLMHGLIFFLWTGTRDVTAGFHMVATHWSGARSYGFFAAGIESGSGIMSMSAVSISVCFLLWPGVVHAGSVADSPSFMMVSGISSSEEMCLTAADGARSNE